MNMDEMKAKLGAAHNRFDDVAEANGKVYVNIDDTPDNVVVCIEKSDLEKDIDQLAALLVEKILQLPVSTTEARLKAIPNFSVGDRVRVKADVTHPTFQWGPVFPFDVGVVQESDRRRRSLGLLSVDFPRMDGWAADPIQMEKVEE